MQDRQDASAPDERAEVRSHRLPVILPAFAILVLIVILALAAWFVSSRPPLGGDETHRGAAATAVEN